MGVISDFVNHIFSYQALLSLAYYASESEITTCIKIDKPLVVYRFSGNGMKLRFKRLAYGKTLTFSGQKYDFRK